MESLNSLHPITNKDIQLITGRKERQVRRLLKRIRKALGKMDGQYITIADFCQFHGYNIAQVGGIIQNSYRKTA